MPRGAGAPPPAAPAVRSCCCAAASGAPGGAAASWPVDSSSSKGLANHKAGLFQPPAIPAGLAGLASPAGNCRKPSSEA